jgi:exodeoxyribonuclease VII large subunit
MSASMRLSELCALIDDTLKNAFLDRAWWVLAEIKERNDKGGYIYFELVEKAENGTEVIARMNASVWRREAVMAFRNFEDITGKRPGKGMQVLVKAGVSFHPVYGLSLQLFDIDSQHMLGQLELQRRKTIELLSKKPGIRMIDGQLLTPNKAIRLPIVIQRIAIITSASAAGYQDFMHTLERNTFGYRFHCTPYFSILQGEKAAGQMKDQLIAIFEDMKRGKEFDAVVMIRGGGAQSDLLPFDDFNLAHAVARFPVAVITGIGHQKDESITDMVAHSPTKTPTQAAEFIIDHNLEFEEAVAGLRELIILRTNNLLTKQHRRLDHAGAIVTNGTIQLLHTAENRVTRLRERISSNVQSRLQRELQRLGETKRNLPALSRRLFEKQNHRLDLLAERMKLLDPSQVLKRGYAMILKNSQPIISAGSATAGDELKILMQDGTIQARVNSVSIEKNATGE